MCSSRCDCTENVNLILMIARSLSRVTPRQACSCQKQIKRRWAALNHVEITDETNCHSHKPFNRAHGITRVNWGNAGYTWSIIKCSQWLCNNCKVSSPSYLLNVHQFRCASIPIMYRQTIFNTLKLVGLLEDKDANCSIVPGPVLPKPW